MVKPRVEQIADVAWELLDTEGEPGLSMRRIAAALGVSAPSLYKHVTCRDDIVALVQGRTLIEGAAVMRRALRRRSADPGLAAAMAYRRWALAHPAQYTLTYGQPLLRHLLPPGLEDQAAMVVVEHAGGDEITARLMFATAHGLISLELAGRFPDDANLDAVWRAAFGRAAH